MAHPKLAIIRRRLFTILSVLSLLLCLATVAVWVRSYWRADAIWHERFGDMGENPQVDDHGFRFLVEDVWSVHSVVGEIDFLTGTRSIPLGVDDPKPKGGWNFETQEASNGLTLKAIESDLRNSTSGSFLGFGFLSSDRGLTLRAVAVPHWFLALLFAILPALWLRSFIRSRRRYRFGLCPVCGYDLRATPQRCPECGTAAVQPQRTQRTQRG